MDCWDKCPCEAWVPRVYIYIKNGSRIQQGFVKTARRSRRLFASMRTPLDSKSPTMNLAVFIFFSFFLIQTIHIFSPHDRPLFAIKYIIIFITYYLISEMNRN